MKIDPIAIEKACQLLGEQKIIAYPTEAVYGFGCDPESNMALTRLLQLKGRDANKGFILVASSWQQLEPYVETLPPPLLARVLATWPGPFTWVMPAQPHVSRLIRGQHDTVAVRVSAHPVIQALCQRYGKAIISTSANQAGCPPTRTAGALQFIFKDQVDYIVPGEVGERANPTEIRDARSGEILRKG